MTVVIFITGPVKSGKSMLAQSLAKTLAGKGDLSYLATMIAGDGEDRLRIKRHIADRDGWGFRTEELPFNPEQTTAGQNGTILLDSITAVLQNLMFHPSSPVSIDQAYDYLVTSLYALCLKVGNAVVVSDYIFSDAQLFNRDLTGLYRRLLGHAHKLMAQKADCVIEVTSSIPKVHKGSFAGLQNGLSLYYSYSGHLNYQNIGE